MDWLDDLLDELEQPTTATFGKVSWIHSLIKTSILSEEEKARIESETFDGMDNQEANIILARLLNNQQDIHQQGDYRQKSLHKHFDRVFGKIE